MQITNNGALVFNQTNNLSLTNIVGMGAGTLTKNGTNTLTLTANNTYNWTTIGLGATVQVGTGGATGSLGSGSVTNDGKLVYNRSGSITAGNIKTGPATGGEVDFLGAANVALNGGNTYINNTVIDGGVVTLGAAEVIPSAATVAGSAGWLVLGILVLVYYAANKRDQWLKTAGAALGESEDDLAMARVGSGASAKV